ncbi:D-2-hydroxyacid dehydrogenase [Sulfurovum sp. NBC37-1]|uniref:D-2-hydroxyacid dehydrogenase n=1 Tax=Sulfurovum sp. (strain NBC37-1) TaxID=387093 RepID=UPI0001587450|nr:D-2-hydroxyacid dehydrogenase [Sulfurovum sp. NBC37-1]BAF71113.1 D-isomer specific 2-hydroxyacid dehydrogenase, catalytic component [Sulfurovum sp. NBC37-1]
MKKQIVILDTETLGGDLDLSVLKRFGDVTGYTTTTTDETLDRIQKAHIVISNKVVLTEEMMQQCPVLELICIAATGMNNVDLEAAEKLGIVVKNVSGYSTHSVVQHTFAILFYLLEHLKYYDNVVQSSLWTISGLFTDVSRPFHEISGKKWGIIGMGTIGQEIAKVATAFGAHVSYYSTSGENSDQPYIQQPLDLLLSTSDIISIHAPLTDKTYGLINETNLPLLKEKAILLNLGRGGIINETDLAYELDRREIYAGLDVLEKEPVEADNRLMQISHKERLLITPHIAWTSIEAREKLLEGIVENIKQFLKATPV